MKLIICCAFLVGVAGAPLQLQAQEVETGFLNRTVTVEGSTHRYQVYVPRDYDPDSAWPVILFLHGAGERGEDGIIQTEVGLGRALRRWPDRYPAIVVLPQAPTEMRWQGAIADVAMAALDRTVGEFRTDPARVYLTGLSMGGNGSWYVGYHHAERFAAVAPICGFVRTLGPFDGGFSDAADPHAEAASHLADTPVWIFHGESDTVVNVEESRKMHAALQAVDAPVKYTELPGTGHNSWDAAYASPSFAEWLFAQRKR